VLEDDAAEHQPETAAHAEHRAQHADGDADLRGRELVAEREDRRARALQHPAEHQRLEPWAAAAPGEPRPKTVSETTSRRRLPCASPSLPRIGVSTDELRRKPVTSHVVQLGEIPRLVPEERHPAPPFPRRPGISRSPAPS
jgi:hypothetical protein